MLHDAILSVVSEHDVDFVLTLMDVTVRMTNLQLQYSQLYRCDGTGSPIRSNLSADGKKAPIIGYYGEFKFDSTQ